MRGLLAIFSVLCFIKQTFSATCGSYTTQQACTTVSKCVWTNNACRCQDLLADFVFLVDTSGSIGSYRFETQKTMIIDLLTNSLPANSGVGIIRFGSTVDTILPLLPRQSLAQVITAVKNMPYTGGSTFMGQAVKDGLTMVAQSTRPNQRIFLVTDGQPNGGVPPDPCALKADIIAATGLHIIILGVGGGFSSAAVSCLVSKEANPSEWIITLQQYDSQLFQSVLPKLDNKFCPQTFDAKITEIKVPHVTQEPWWFEFINNGVSNIQLANLGVRGIFNGQFDIYGGNLVLAPGQAAVVYEYSATKNVPSCQSCTKCPLTTSPAVPAGSPVKWCSNALYIACGAPNGPPCTVAAANMHLTNFNVELYDYTGSPIRINQVTFDATNGWVPVLDGYSYELKSWSVVDNANGVNWLQSCNIYGTPGDVPLKNCTAGCVPSYCQSRGDKNATCDLNTNTCKCSGQYFYPDSNVCITLQAPAWCIATKVKLNPTTQIVRFTWATVSTPPDVIYQGNYLVTNQNRPSSYTSITQFKDVFDYDQNVFAAATKFGSVQSLVIRLDSAGAKVYYTSRETNCTTATSAPTPSPTAGALGAYVGGDICLKDRCSCNGAGLSCTGNPISRTLFTGGTEVLTISRQPIDYSKNLTVFWEVVPQGQPNNHTYVKRRLLQANNGTGNSSIPANFTSDIVPASGTTIIAVGTAGTKIQLNVTGQVYSQYLFKIIGCSSPAQAGCSVVYPDQLVFSINLTTSGGSSVSITQNQTPVWLWWVIALLALFLLLLAWLVYRYWWKNKQTTGQLHQAEADLDDAVAENELGFAHDLGAGDVVFNPIATGVPGSSKAPDYFSNEMANRKGDAANQRADVPVEKFQHREQFGQVAAPKDTGNDLAQPLLGR